MLLFFFQHLSLESGFVLKSKRSNSAGACPCSVISLLLTGSNPGCLPISSFNDPDLPLLPPLLNFDGVNATSNAGSVALVDISRSCPFAQTRRVIRICSFSNCTF